MADDVDQQLRALGTRKRAVRDAAYLRSELVHHGVPVPDVRRVARDTVRRASPSHDELVALAEALWARPVHECRAAAIEVLRSRVDLLAAPDLVLLERLLRQSRTWALVDNLAVEVVGPLAAAHPASASTLDRWAQDDDRWLRRSALLALLVPLRQGGGDFERFSRYADAMLDDPDPFIRKAIGWVLRDTAKKRPELVVDWLLPRASRASGVTIREATKHLDDDRRRAVLDAR